MFEDVLNRRIVVDGQTVTVPKETTPGHIIRTIGKDPDDTSLVSRGANGTTQYLPTKRQIRVRDGQELESSMTGIGG